MDRFTAGGLHSPGAVRGGLGISEFRNPVGATLAVAFIVSGQCDPRGRPHYQGDRKFRPLIQSRLAINKFGNQKQTIIRN